jgi:hypothetical protein
MDFSDTELHELAVFLSRRLGPELKPIERGTSAGDARAATAQADWERVLREARTAGRVPRVLQSAARALPRDLALQEAARLVNPTAPVQSWVAGGLMVVASAALILLVMAGFTTTGMMVAMEASTLSSSALPAGVPSGTLQALGSADVAMDGGNAATGDASRPVEAHLDAGSVPPRVEEVATAVPRPEDGPAGGALRDGLADVVEEEASLLRQSAHEDSCKAEGWVYAGRQRPAGAFVARYPVRVRTQPPTKENGWSSSMPIRCYLRKGDVVRMDQAALELPHHHFWVHVVPDMIERADGVALGDTGTRR